MQTLFKRVSYEFAFALTKGDDGNDIDDDCQSNKHSFHLFKQAWLPPV
jgi:hypothetical protein